MEQVSNNKEKQFVYAVEYARLTKAIKLGFYLEAITIGYALIEDRVTTFLHYAGIMSRGKNKLTINHSVYPYVRVLLNKKDNQKITLWNLSTKIDIILALLKLTEQQANEIDLNVGDFVKKNAKRRIARQGYMLDVCSQIDETVDAEKVINTLEALDEWKDIRNRLIHALLNQKVSSSKEAEKECAESIYVLSRSLDNDLVKPFKKSNNIRRKYRIQ